MANPVNRKEAILNGEDITPVTREEAILSGADVEPLSREEYFIQKRLNEGGGGGGGSLEVYVPEQTVTTVLSNGYYLATLSKNPTIDPDTLEPDTFNITINGVSYDNVEKTTDDENGIYYGDMTFTNYPFVIWWGGLQPVLETQDAGNYTIKVEGVPKLIKFEEANLTINVTSDTTGGSIEYSFPAKNDYNYYSSDISNVALNSNMTINVQGIMFMEDVSIMGVIKWDQNYNVEITNTQDCVVNVTNESKAYIYIKGMTPSLTIKSTS